MYDVARRVLQRWCGRNCSPRWVPLGLILNKSREPPRGAVHSAWGARQFPEKTAPQLLPVALFTVVKRTFSSVHVRGEEATNALAFASKCCRAAAVATSREHFPPLIAAAALFAPPPGDGRGR